LTTNYKSKRMSGMRTSTSTSTSPDAPTPFRLSPLVTRQHEAEVLGAAPDTIQLLANAPDIGGFVSATRVRLGEGHGGATPHLHRSAAELFFVVDGELQVLIGDHVVTAQAGDTLVIPPDTVHAFGAAPGSTADALIVIAPGVERSAYFRLLDRIRLGTSDPAELVATQELYDNHFVSSATWDTARQAA
jgi:mannose-6-phosphate isomerase-like protein (cupin superfamily)